MDDIKISIIIPAYNAEDTLPAALDSAVNQTLDQIEIIVVNDGSTDGTGEVIRQYEKKYPNKVLGLHQENAGVSTARNLGLELAKGTYIGFLDADDTVCPTMCEKMYNCAEEQDADLVQCWRYDVSKDARTIRGPKKKCVGTDIYENPEIISAQTPFVWDKIFRRSVIEENEICFQPFRYAEDILFIFQFELSAHNIAACQYPLYNYSVRREGAVTASFSEALLDAPRALAALNDLALDSGYFPSFVRYLWKVEVYFYIRRLNDFWLYDDKKLQETIARDFFQLFNDYFYNWKTTVCNVGASKRIQVKAYAYRSDWNKMLRFIYSPLWIKRVLRKLVYLFVLMLKKKDNIISKCKKLFSNPKRKWNNLYRELRQRQPAAAYAKYRRTPIKKNTVLLTSYYGSSFSDSIYYMARDLLNREGLTIYIGTNSIKRELSFITYNKMRPILVDVRSEKYLEILATAQYLVCNSRFPSYFFKRDDQIYLNTWHGTPLKTLGKDIKHGLKDIGNNQTNFMMCDFLLYPNEYTRRCIMDSFYLDKLFTGDVMMCGYPRNAAFFDSEDAKNLRKKLKLEDKRVYFYMPTWRGETLDSREVESYGAELNAMLETLDEQLNDDIVIFVKLHQVVMRKVPIKQFKHFRLPHPLYENYRLLNIADGLITDYSSVFFDFANSKKEIILFTYDYELYMEQRGMYFDMASLPFPRANSVDELSEYLNEGKTFLPSDAYLAFCSEYCKYDSQGAPQSVNDTMLQKNTTQIEHVISYEQNADKSFDVCFMSNLGQIAQKVQFEQLADSAADTDLFVFAQWSFSEKTNSVLSQYAKKDICYVVAPGEMPVTIYELICLKLYRKVRLCKKTAQRIYLEELKRILPNIKIRSIKNYSNDPKYTDMCNALNQQFGKTDQI